MKPIFFLTSFELHVQYMYLIMLDGYMVTAVTSPPGRLATSELATKERSRHQRTHHQAKSSCHQPPIKR